MTLVAVVESQSEWFPPRARISITANNTGPNAVPDNSIVSVVRVLTDGSRAKVITELNPRIVGGTRVIEDRWAPSNEPLTYEITAAGHTVTATPIEWQATDPNLIPVDPGTGGLARMIGWWLGGILTTSAGAVVVPAGKSILSDPLPVIEGEKYSIGISANADATMRLQFYVGQIPLGGPLEVSTTGADRPFVTGLEAPSGATHVTIEGIATAGAATFSHPTLQEGEDYPGIADPVTATSSAPAELQSDDVWLIDKAIESRSVRVESVATITGQTYPVKVGRFDIPFRRNAVQKTDGVLKGEQGSLVITCFSDAGVAAVMQLLRSASPFFVKTPASEGWDIKRMWIQPGQISKANEDENLYAETRVITIPYEECDQPVVIAVGRRTYEFVEDTDFPGMTYEEVEALYNLYDDAENDTRHA